MIKISPQMMMTIIMAKLMGKRKVINCQRQIKTEKFNIQLQLEALALMLFMITINKQVIWTVMQFLVNTLQICLIRLPIQN